MTEQTYPYEALLAFCQTKGPAFDSFMREWQTRQEAERTLGEVAKKAAPSPTVKPVEEPAKIQIAVAPTPPPAPTAAAVPDWGATKKPKAKTDAATATSPTSTVNTES